MRDEDDDSPTAAESLVIFKALSLETGYSNITATIPRRVEYRRGHGPRTRAGWYADMSADKFLARLCALVPPPGSSLISEAVERRSRDSDRRRRSAARRPRDPYTPPPPSTRPVHAATAPRIRAQQRRRR